ncbi:glycosyltransferase family 4 protein [Candidatus Saccharibacteria bacterium]|nr:glycosyltransferase family 4 protein [Candidatus Saccharibacteria bacterium]
MKILMLGWELPPHNSGGLGVACLNMARALARGGEEIDFVLPYAAQHPGTSFMHILSATNLDPIHRYGGVYYHGDLEQKIIPAERGTGADYLSIRDVQGYYQDYVKEQLTTLAPDVIHAHDWLTYEAGIIAKRATGAPLIAHVHATEYDRAGAHAGNPIIHEVEYEGLTQADEIIAVSNATKDIIHEKYGVPLDKISVIYNSLDEDYQGSAYHFSENYYEYLCGKKRAGYHIVSTVGRFTAQKGLKNLMEAAALAIKQDPKLIFVFAGDGEERNALIRLSADLKISENVLFTGFIRGQKLRDIYAISDIFVMSSISEPFGLTALEAAHHGDALILTKQSGVAEVIWSAMKYDFWDEKKLANEILAVAHYPVLRESLQRNVQHEYNRLSWDAVAKKCISVYNKAMKYRSNVGIRNNFNDVGGGA